MGGNEQKTANVNRTTVHDDAGEPRGYVPLPVTPTENYPFRTDYEFLHGQYPHETQDEGVPQGMTNFPNLAFDPENTYQTHIVEANKKFYIVPSFKKGQDPEDLFNENGLHLGGFNSERDALQYERDLEQMSNDALRRLLGNL